MVTYKKEDSLHNNGTVNGEVVLYGQNFGYASPAPAVGTQPVYVITATGRAANGTEKTIQIETVRQSFRINLNAALSSGLDVKATGTCFIDGTNHNKLLNLSWGTQPGEYKNPSDDGLGARIYNDKIASGSSVSAWAPNASTTSKMAIVTTTGKYISYKSPTETRGPYTWGASGADAVQEGGISQIPDFKDFLGITQPELDVLLNSADVTLTDLNNGAAPRGFTYINNPGSTFMYSASTPDPIGYTLMYVKGNLKMTANTKFKGVIFVEGDFTITGSPTILGGVVVRGDTDTTFSPGNINILYSSGVIEEINNNLGFFKTLVWREIQR